MDPDVIQHLGDRLGLYLLAAWLLPLAGFAIEIFGGYWSGVRSKTPAYLAIGCIGGAFVCSAVALGDWMVTTNWAEVAFAGHGGHHAEDGHAHEAHADEHHEGEGHAGHDDPHAAEHGEHAGIPAFSGTYYTLAKFGSLVVGIDWYVDGLTLTMFVMVTLIATCIHVFAIGYMSDELTPDHVDHEVHLPDGSHLHRPGRFYRFFAYMSLFSFSMLGLVLAGNVFQVFVFWELVGICSYLLIGFYTERKSASTAANKAFIMNRVGDFGFLIGLMVLLVNLQTFRFADHTVDGQPTAGVFTQIRGHDGQLDVETLEDGTRLAVLHDAEGEPEVAADGRTVVMPYYLLIIAGLGVFAGCIGKSAQFPLHTWLPDAMEGPTPVSALVHSATMVAAGVYLAGRMFPLFTPEVLLVIAYVGCITLFLAATIAVVATDIKRVLAYSTISQLGYMMLGIGVGGWGAGLFHLITHAFFKSLMFLASGSVIHGCHHEQEMTRMGGLWRKMPITAFTMLVGVIAISGLAIPGISVFGYKIAFSGFHSKDAIVATALAYHDLNVTHFLLFLVPLVTAGITAFYMFRLWFWTFSGKPRDEHLYEHCHESPAVMTVPLIVLSLFAAFIAFDGESFEMADGDHRPGTLYATLAANAPPSAAEGLMQPIAEPLEQPQPLRIPSPDYVHGHVDESGAVVEELLGPSPHERAGVMALIAAFAGTFLAFLLYGARVVDPAEIGRQLSGLHTFLREKWRFDELYDTAFTRPVHVVASWATVVDRYVFDGFLHNVARGTVNVAKWDRRFDEGMIDGLVNWVGDATYGFGRSLRGFQTGSLRQYVMFIAVGVLTLFVLLFAFFPVT